MLVTEFAKKYNFKGVDYKIAQKVYGKRTMTEDEWFLELGNKFDYDTDEFRKQKKIRDAKAKKASSKKNNKND